MSNLYDNDKNIFSPASEAMAKSHTEAKKWPTLQAELNEAVELWRQLETKISPKSPQDIQLQELKDLILQVKNELKSFDSL